MTRARQDVVKVVTAFQSALRDQQGALDCADAAAVFLRRFFGGSSATVTLMDFELQQYRTITNVGDLSVGEEHHPDAEIYRFDTFPWTTQQLLRGGAYFASLSDPDCPPEQQFILKHHAKRVCMGAPIRLQGRPLGEIWVTRTEDETFTEDDADLAVACGATLARILSGLPSVPASRVSISVRDASSVVT